jgi:hypothetical protein
LRVSVPVLSVQIDRGRAQRLDRRQAPDHRVARRHALDADGERDRDDGGKALGDQRHSERHDRHQRVVPLVVAHEDGEGEELGPAPGTYVLEP